MISEKSVSIANANINENVRSTSSRAWGGRMIQICFLILLSTTNAFNLIMQS